MNSVSKHDLVRSIPSGKLRLDALVLTLAATHFLTVDTMMEACHAGDTFIDSEKRASVKKAVEDALLMYRIALAETGKMFERSERIVFCLDNTTQGRA